MDARNPFFNVPIRQVTIGGDVGPLLVDGTATKVSEALGGRKNDAGKSRMELLSPVALDAMARVLAFGAAKYSDHNWRGGFKWSRLYGAAMRHLLAHMDGQDKDPETGESHLAHAACCLMFLLEHEAKGLGNDDRYKKAP